MNMRGKAEIPIKAGVFLLPCAGPILPPETVQEGFPPEAADSALLCPPFIEQIICQRPISARPGGSRPNGVDSRFEAAAVTYQTLHM